MASLADRPQLIGFFSYAREDDRDSGDALSALRARIQSELRGLLGRRGEGFRLFQDREAIPPGKLWEKEIKAAIEEAVFFIPIITPTALSSPHCRFEFKAFLERERALGRSDLVFPIIYIEVPDLNIRGRAEDNKVFAMITQRQHVDWCWLRHYDERTREVREEVTKLCRSIRDALQRPQSSDVELERRRRGARERERRLVAEREREAAAQREREAAVARELEAAAQRERKAAAQREREAVAERKRETAAQRKRETAAQREREAAAQREREATTERERKAAALREWEAAVERERKAAALREWEAAVQREREAAAQREREAAVQREREAAAQREREAAAQRITQPASSLMPILVGWLLIAQAGFQGVSWGIEANVFSGNTASALLGIALNLMPIPAFFIVVILGEILKKNFDDFIGGLFFLSIIVQSCIIFVYLFWGHNFIFQISGISFNLTFGAMPFTVTMSAGLGIALIGRWNNDNLSVAALGYFLYSVPQIICALVDIPTA